MKTTLIQIDRPWMDSYYLGIGIGYEKDSDEFFVGIVIAFFVWNIRIGIDRSPE